jgi:hypothetical protein
MNGLLAYLLVQPAIGFLLYESRTAFVLMRGAVLFDDGLIKARCDISVENLFSVCLNHAKWNVMVTRANSSWLRHVDE